MPDRCTRTSASLLALLAGSIALSGCSDRDADSREVAAAARHLGSVGVADAPSTTVSYANATSKINAVQVEGDDATAVTAGLLGQSLLGEASVTAKDAALAERTVLADMARARSLASRYQALSTEASALEAFDPSGDLDRIAGEVRGLEADARTARADRDTLSERIAGLDSRADTLRAESGSKRDEAAEMELASAGLSATEAASRAGRIRELSREADALDMQIARLTGEVETLTPRLSEFDGEIDKLTQQITLAEEAADDLRQMATARAARASTARAEAGEIAEAIRGIVNDIDAARTGAVIPAGEQATQSLERSIRESEKAARSVRPTGTLGKSAAQRRLAELFQLRSDGHARYAGLLETLGAIGGLPNASSYAEAAGGEFATSEELRARAAESFENAASSLSSVSVRGTDSERIRETTERLNEHALRLRGEPETPTEPADANPPSDGDGQP